MNIQLALELIRLPCDVCGGRRSPPPVSISHDLQALLAAANCIDCGHRLGDTGRLDDLLDEARERHLTAERCYFAGNTLPALQLAIEARQLADAVLPNEDARISRRARFVVACAHLIEGNALDTAGQCDAACRAFALAESGFRDLGDSLRAATAQSNLASSLDQLGSRAEARRLFELAFAELKSFPPRLGSARVLNSLLIIATSTGDVDSCRRWLAAADRLWRGVAIAESFGLESAHRHLVSLTGLAAAVLRLKPPHLLAQTLADWIDERAWESFPHEELAVRGRLSTLRAWAGLDASDESNLWRMLDVANKCADSVARSVARTGLATLLLQRGDLGTARDLASAALRDDAAIGRPTWVALDRKALAQIDAAAAPSAREQPCPPSPTPSSAPPTPATKPSLLEMVRDELSSSGTGALLFDYIDGKIEVETLLARLRDLKATERVVDLTASLPIAEFPRIWVSALIARELGAKHANDPLQRLGRERLHDLLTEMGLDGLALLKCERWADAFAVSEEHLKLANECRDSKARTVALLVRGHAILALGQPDEAEQSLRELICATKSLALLVQAQHLRARALRQLGRFEDAELCIDEALKSLGELPADAALSYEVTLLAERSLLHVDRGRPEDALDDCELAVKACERADSPRMLIPALTRRSALLLATRQVEAASADSERARVLARTLGDSHLLYGALAQFTQLCLWRQDALAGISAAHEALDLETLGIGTKPERLAVRGNLALLLGRAGHAVTGRQLLERVADDARELSLPAEESAALEGLLESWLRDAPATRSNHEIVARLQELHRSTPASRGHHVATLHAAQHALRGERSIGELRDGVTRALAWGSERKDTSLLLMVHSILIAGSARLGIDPAQAIAYAEHQLALTHSSGDSTEVLALLVLGQLKLELLGDLRAFDHLEQAVRRAETAIRDDPGVGGFVASLALARQANETLLHALASHPGLEARRTTELALLAMNRLQAARLELDLYERGLGCSSATGGLQRSPFIDEIRTLRSHLDRYHGALANRQSPPPPRATTERIRELDESQAKWARERGLLPPHALDVERMLPTGDAICGLFHVSEHLLVCFRAARDGDSIDVDLRSCRGFDGAPHLRQLRACLPSDFEAWFAQRRLNYVHWVLDARLRTLPVERLLELPGVRSPSPAISAALRDRRPSQEPRILILAAPLLRLPWIEKEAEAIRELWEQLADVELVRLDTDLVAARETIARFAPTHLHLCAHVEGSAIVGGEKRIAIDDLLGDIDLLRCDLAVLAACRTLSLRGHDALDWQGASSAFLLAGAREIIATLGDVDDAKTYAFSVALHEELTKTPFDTASAFERAKLRLRETADLDLSEFVRVGG